MVTEQTKSFNNWRQETSRGYYRTTNYQNKAAGISTDIERSRSFARTLRQSSYRWWTAKYDNAPRFTGRGESGLQSSLLSQSAPDLLSQSQPRSRPVRTGSLSTRPLPGAAGRSLARAGSVAQSDLGLRPEPGRHQLEQGGAGGWPVTVKSLQLQDRQDRRANLVKIRYPGSRSSSRPKLRHKINLQMKKEEPEG